MKKSNKLNFLLTTGLGVLMALYSCQKQAQVPLQTTTTATAATINNNGAILVASASQAGSSAPTDDVYVINAYPPDAKKDSVTFASLPAAIATYLNANYAGYTYQKSFKILTPTGAVDSYDVIILFNGKPVGLKFDTTGNFVLVLQQCEGHDLGGKGWHDGGRFGERDGMHRDTIALTALPTVIKAYFTTNYPADTLLHAALTPEGTYIVISANKGLYATTLTTAGVLINRMQVYPPHANNHTPIAQSALPAAITTYLTKTFPGYVFDKAFVEKLNTTVQEYDVFINVNGTRQAIEFDATGAFVKSITIR